MRYLLCLIGIHSFGNWSPTYAKSARPAFDVTQRKFCNHCNAIKYRTVDLL
jgi:hypothetical protein